MSEIICLFHIKEKSHKKNPKKIKFYFKKTIVKISRKYSKSFTICTEIAIKKLI